MKNVLMGLGLVWALAGCGMTAPRDSQGFADLGSLGLFDFRNTMNLSVGPTLLRFAARQVEDDPEIQAVLSGLDGVRLRRYEIRRNPDQVSARLTAMSEKLEGNGWQEVVRVLEEDEEVHVLVRQRGETIEGVTVLTLEGTEVTVINVMGELRPRNLPQLTHALTAVEGRARSPIY